MATDALPLKSFVFARVRDEEHQVFPGILEWHMFQKV